MRIGIAGYMGAGKSTCADTFNSSDTSVINADAEAKLLMLSDSKILLDLKEAFGECIDNGGTIDFHVLGCKAFSSADTLLTLNKIIHPPLVKHLENLVLGCEKPYCILDAALIPQWRIESWFDLCIWFDLPFEVRLKRLMAKRTGADENELRLKMRLQEEIMSVPQGDCWIKLPDYECGQYIRSRFEVKTPDKEEQE